MIASLNTHQCFVGLPNPKIRIAKITVPIAKHVVDHEQGFVMRKYDAANTEDHDSKLHSDIKTDSISGDTDRSFDIPLKSLSFKKSPAKSKKLQKKSIPRSKKQVTAIEKRKSRIEPEISLNIK